MVVLNEKDIIPPPPYYEPATVNAATTAITAEVVAGPGPSSTAASTASRSSSTSGTRRQLSGRVVAPPLPAHVLLLIVYATLPRQGELVNTFAADGRRIRVRENAEATALRTTRTFYWIAFYLRLVNRGLYLASMHLLRSTFLGDYNSLVRPPYSSDPFPHTSLAANARQRGPVVSTIQSEAQILDLYILHRLHEDVFSADSSLHIDRAHRTADLFAFMQPRARLADLVRAFGAGAGLVALGGNSLGGSSSISNAVEDEGMLSSLVASQRAREHELLRARLRERAAAVNASRVPQRQSTTPSASMRSTLQPPPPPPQPQLTPQSTGASLKSRSQLSLPSYESRPASPAPSLSRNSTTAPVAGPSRPRSKAVEAGYSEDDIDEKRSVDEPYSFSLTVPTTRRQRRVPHTALRVSFSPRRIGLVYVPPGAGSGAAQHQSVADLPRTGDEPLERAASRLVAALKVWLDSRPSWVE